MDYFNESVSRKIITYKEAFAYVLPDIKAFYKRKSDYDGILQFIVGQKENGYYCFMNWNGLVLSEIFIAHYLGDAEALLKLFSELRITDAVLQEALHRKLLEAPVQQAPGWLPGTP